MKKISIIAIMALITCSAYVSAQPDCSSTARRLPNCVNCCCDGCNGRTQYTSQTFMFTHPLTQNLALAQALRQDLIYNKPGCLGASVEIIGAYQQSNPLPKNALYFTPFCKETLKVAGDNVYGDTCQRRDIRAEWLGLSSNFNGDFSLCPEQKQTAIIVSYNQHLDIFDHPLLEGFWVSADLSLLAVENNLNVKQHTFADTTPTDIISIGQALNQCAWLYSKIDGCQRIVHPGDINIKLGSTYLAENHFVLAYYSQMSLPTSNGQNPAYLFSPVAGNNNHFGYGGGVNLQVLLNRDATEYAICFFLGLDDLFLIRKTEMRTLNLKCNPWSRYLLLTRRDGNLGNAVPGVNILTREVRARPYSMFDFSTGLRFQSHGIEIEVGYDIWGHSTERIELRCPFPEDYGILGDPGLTPLAPDVFTVTASQSTICEQRGNIPGNRFDTNSDGQAIFVPILQSDLDLNSAASQRSLNQKFHIAFGTAKSTDSSGFIFGLGAFFEWPKYNSALQLIGFWAKLGASF
jgi:hypothetical protein